MGLSPGNIIAERNCWHRYVDIDIFEKYASEIEIMPLNGLGHYL